MRAGAGRRRSAAIAALRVAAGRDRIVERALEPRPPARSGAEGLGLKIGDDVRHKTFGEGVIIDMSGSGDKTEALVRFRDVGEKSCSCRGHRWRSCDAILGHTGSLGTRARICQV